MSVKTFLADMLLEIVHGPGSRLEVSTRDLAVHYANGGEPLRLTELPKRPGYTLIPARGQWPLIERVTLVQDHEDRDIACIDLACTSKGGPGEFFYLEPDDLVTVVPK